MLDAETEQYLHHRFCLIAHHSKDRVTRILYFAIRFNQIANFKQVKN